MQSLNRAERFEVKARVLLELSDKRAFIGNTVNVSASGVFFDIGYPPFQVELHENGLLHLMPLVMKNVIPCQIARLTPTGIAIQFLENQPAGLTSQLLIVPW
ncbi:MAG: PilZ domain-containing protein [Magnetococcales bacterium]|nr:PilZ domain-containing protein [Magnetococcales bacterium]NGZ06880.1 PilZ domain-containing protein [Magnetococcales bacterium]